MSTAHLNTATSTFFLLSTIILCLPATTRTDEPCTYPCYPPPTGSGTPTTPSGTIPPPAPPQSGSTYPPPSRYYYNPPTPYGGGGGGLYGAPPPPDPILPYFPFYYREPRHKIEGESSASITLRKWTRMIATTSLLFSLLLLFV